MNLLCTCRTSPAVPFSAWSAAAYSPNPATSSAAAPIPALRSFLPVSTGVLTSGSSLTAWRTSSYRFPRFPVHRSMTLDNLISSLLVSPGTTDVYASMNCIVFPNPNGAGAGMVEIEQGDSTDTRYFRSEDGLTEVEVTVQDEMKDEYQIETAETGNGEVTVSISSEASEAE